ncbi:MAG: class I SAM-dependent methyltransferase [Pseudomonadota bacterium]
MMSTLNCLNDLHQKLAPGSYLEIGVREGASLALSRCSSIGIDPAFNIKAGITCPVSLYKMISDDFFAQTPRSDIFSGSAIDFGFIDGYHNFDFALRDFINLEKLTHSRSVIVFDDVLPRDEKQAELKPHGGAWAGDVWRIMRCLRTKRPDLKLTAVSTNPCGLLIITGCDAANSVLADNYDDVVRAFTGGANTAYPGCEALLEEFNFVETLPAINDLFHDGLSPKLA